jgi:hypothetical protein
LGSRSAASILGNDDLDSPAAQLLDGLADCREWRVEQMERADIIEADN